MKRDPAPSVPDRRPAVKHEIALQDGEPITLTPDEQRVFMKALLNPPPPGSRLRAAARRYRKVVGR
jgi:uncharacterized protein (DUF1778 family)